MPRLHSFGAKLLLLCVLIVAAAQFVTYVIVSRQNRKVVRHYIETDLAMASARFERLVADRNDILSIAGRSVAGDYAFKRLFGESPDRLTLVSALESIRLRIGADYVTVVSLAAETLASTEPLEISGGVVPELVAHADADTSDALSATGYGYLDHQLYSLVTVPVRAPDVVAWLVIGFKIDHKFVERLKDQSRVEVTFTDDSTQFSATTLPESNFRLMQTQLSAARNQSGVTSVHLSDGDYLTTTRTLSAGQHLNAILALQYSLDEELRPFKDLELWLIGVTAGSLLLAALVSIAFARRLSRPVEALALHTEVIARGDYRTLITLDRTDELGRLAQSFNRMSAGLAERDRVRDLLDKNVSPEIAAQLMRDGSALGGEEREVTVLFADLRGFTTLSEKLPPRELIALLNRYLDCMSAALEAHGGIIDKYIGDAIMALFGAPIALSDAADRAIAAALAMERALVTLNAELTAEGRPPLAIGVGINTAQIIAGNIGSHRRLNYSVIGDGVNIAARLQSLTRTSEYRTNIIVSAATVSALREKKFTTRALGKVSVKGRAEPVEIFAVEE